MQATQSIESTNTGATQSTSSGVSSRKKNPPAYIVAIAVSLGCVVALEVFIVVYCCVKNRKKTEDKNPLIKKPKSISKKKSEDWHPKTRPVFGKIRMQIEVY